MQLKNMTLNKWLGIGLAFGLQHCGPGQGNEGYLGNSPIVSSAYSSKTFSAGTGKQVHLTAVVVSTTTDICADLNNQAGAVGPEQTHAVLLTGFVGNANTESNETNFTISSPGGQALTTMFSNWLNGDNTKIGFTQVVKFDSECNVSGELNGSGFADGGNIVLNQATPMSAREVAAGKFEAYFQGDHSPMHGVFSANRCKAVDKILDRAAGLLMPNATSSVIGPNNVNQIHSLFTCQMPTHADNANGKPLTEQAADAAQTVGEQAAPTAKEVGQRVDEAAGQTVDRANETANQAGETAAELGNQAGENTAQAANVVSEGVQEAGDKAAELGSKASENTAQAANVVSEGAQEAGKKVAENAQQAASAVAEEAQQSAEAAKESAEKALSQTGNLMQDAMEAVNKATNDIVNAAGISTNSGDDTTATDNAGEEGGKTPKKPKVGKGKKNKNLIP